MPAQPLHALPLALVLLAAAPAAAEVVDVGAAGFTTRHAVTIQAGRAEVYRAAVGEVARWWSDGLTASGRAANLRLEARPQGCFCERLGPPEAGIVHMTVTFVNPGVMLRLSGGLGPLGLMGVAGNLTWEFREAEAMTEVVWTYAVGGWLPEGADAMADAVDAALGEQVGRLKAYVEDGAAAGEGAQ